MNHKKTPIAHFLILVYIMFVGLNFTPVMGFNNLQITKRCPNKSIITNINQNFYPLLEINQSENKGLNNPAVPDETVSCASPVVFIFERHNLDFPQLKAVKAKPAYLSASYNSPVLDNLQAPPQIA